MKQIIFLGRGGQGAVTSSQVLAISAFIDGKQSQAFPNFGVERTGAPVRSYCRIDDKKINLREQLKEADYALILDPTLTKNLNEKITSLIIVNSNKKPVDLGLQTNAKVICIDITKVAMEKIGKPFVNISALGAFAALTNEITLESLEKAVLQQMGAKGSIVEKNIEAVREVYKISKNDLQK
ncbi:MAG: 2-oxoacid:acceptor oxidoreductase family protein [Candidatus ainarchaeum sp.]|nr:2-oxoacid:acceptor oxidoreductase family protein [Candidatus ainarchaeum sp.]